MKPPHPGMVLLLLSMSIASASPACMAQGELGNELADRIQDASEMTIVFNDLKIVANDVACLFNDLGLAGLVNMSDEYLLRGADSGYSVDGGLILYVELNRFDAVVQFEIEDLPKLNDTLDTKNNSSDELAPWIEVAPNVKLPLTEYNFARIVDRRLYVGDDDCRPRVERIMAAPPLADRLDARCRKIINQAGVSWIGSGTVLELDHVLGFKTVIDEAAPVLTEAERQWLEEFAEVASSPQLAVVGLKYQDKILNLRARALIEDQVSFDSLFNLSKTGRDWRPDLGLVPERLVLAAAIQMDCFHSSAGPRVVPHTLLQEFGRSEQLDFLRGNMLNVLLELAGDSWNELRAGRIALYQNEDAAKFGQLSIVGVVDAVETLAVMDELKRLSALTQPAASEDFEEQRRREIQRLVEELASSDPNTVARAETRLFLAGPAALPALKKLAESDDASTQKRAGRVIVKIESRSGLSAIRVGDPWFWSTLNPGLQLAESTGKVGGFPAHTVKVTPDPSKSADEVQQAIVLMESLFGPAWNEIRFVQVADHFVFMIGSDAALLERIAKNVNNQTSLLTRAFAGGETDIAQAQLQLFVNTIRLGELLELPRFINSPLPDDNHPCWIGLGFEHNAANIDFLVPVEQVIPFLTMGF